MVVFSVQKYKKLYNGNVTINPTLIVFKDGIQKNAGCKTKSENDIVIPFRFVNTCIRGSKFLLITSKWLKLI